ncbi:MAG TPA: hypothetical protein VGX48_06410 [Pyrinomonadaceae bacterium]|jgi:hypothetical protein|nr:hypothetical protein [Pyrinomonadaceae bacterium]
MPTRILLVTFSLLVPCVGAARAQVTAPKRPEPVVTNNPAPGPPVALSVRKPFIDAETYLHFIAPRAVRFNTGSAEFNATEFWQDGSVWVFFKPDAPGKHQLDCEVEKSGAGDFTLTVPDWAGKVAPAPVKPVPPTRAVFTFELADAKARAFILHANARWTFKGCEVTRLK